MNMDQLTGIVRACIPALVAWIVAKLGLPVTDLTGFDDALVVVVVTGIAAIWSIFNNSTGKIIGSS